MKRLFIIIFILILLSIAFFILSGNGISYNSSDELTAISPYSKHLSQLTKLYFIDGNQLISENRNIKIEKLEVEFAVVEELKKGSKIQNYSSPFNSEITIISVITSDRICYVNLSQNFTFEISDDRLYLNVMAIVNSLTEFESVDYVQILIDGKKMKNTLYSDLEAPISRNLGMVQLKELFYKDIVKKFFDNITLGRYDLAYDLIDSASKQYINFDDFREELILIREELRGYTQRFMFTKREDGKFIVLVNYALREYASSEDIISDITSPLERVYSWHVIQEKGIWKIKYFDME